MASWMTIVVVVNENDPMFDLVDVDLNIDDKEK